MARLDRQRTIILAALFIALFFIVAGTTQHGSDLPHPVHPPIRYGFDRGR